MMESDNVEEMPVSPGYVKRLVADMQFIINSCQHSCTKRFDDSFW